jgi:hypothetical protein
MNVLTLLSMTDEEILAEFNKASNQRCTRCIFCENCRDCKECDYCKVCSHCVSCARCENCFKCTGCVDCYSCIGIANKRYMIHNRQFVSTVYAAAIVLLHQVGI